MLRKRQSACGASFILNQGQSLVAIENHYKIIIMYLMVMKILWNGHTIILCPGCCVFIKVATVIGWLVMVCSLCVKWSYVQRLEILWTYKGKEGSYSGGVYSFRGSYGAGGGGSYTEGGSYDGCSEKDGGSYDGCDEKDVGSYEGTGHSERYRDGYGGGCKGCVGLYGKKVHGQKAHEQGVSDGTNNKKTCGDEKADDTKTNGKMDGHRKCNGIITLTVCYDTC